MNINSIYKKLTIALSIFCGVTLIWIGVITDTSSAQVQAYNSFDSQSTVLLAMDSDDMMNPIEQVFGDGTTDKIEGKVQKDIGATQRTFGNTPATVQGTVKQAKGNAKQGIGEVKNRLDDAGDSVEDAGENLFDAAKNLFSN